MRNFKRLSIILTVCSLGLYSLSLLITTFTIGDLGIANGLPVSYFISLGLLAVAAIMSWHSQENTILSIAQTLIMIVMIWLTPILIGGIGVSPALPTAIDHYANAEYIARTGMISPSVDWYQYWPGMSIVGAFIIQVLNISQSTLIVSITPFILELLLFIPLYILFSHLTGSRGGPSIWVPIWLFYAANWVGLDIFSSHALAFFLFLLLLGLLVSPKFEHNQSQFIILFLLLFTALVATHFLTTLTLIAVMMFLMIRKRITKITTSSYLLVLAFVITLGWFSYLTYPYFANQQGAQAIRDIFRWDLLLDKINAIHPVGASSFTIISRIQSISTFFIIFLGLAGFIVGWKRRHDPGRIKATAIAFGISLVTFIVAYGYSNELIHRWILFMLPIIAYFAGQLVQSTRIIYSILFVSIIILLPLNIISHYGMITTSYLSTEHLNLLKFMDGNISEGKILNLSPYEGFGLSRYVGLLSYYNPPEEIEIGQEVFNRFDVSHGVKYIPIGMVTQNSYQYVYNKPDYVSNFIIILENNSRYNLIYCNSPLELVYESS